MNEKLPFKKKLPLKYFEKYIDNYKPTELEQEVLKSRPKEFLQFVRLLGSIVFNMKQKQEIYFYSISSIMKGILDVGNIHPYFLCKYLLNEFGSAHFEEIIQGYKNGLSFEQIQFMRNLSLVQNK